MISAWLVHLYAASVGVLAFLAVICISDDHHQDAFFWLACALVVDAADGARWRAGAPSPTR